MICVTVFVLAATLAATQALFVASPDVALRPPVPAAPLDACASRRDARRLTSADELGADDVCFLPSAVEPPAAKSWARVEGSVVTYYGTNVQHSLMRTQRWTGWGPRASDEACRNGRACVKSFARAVVYRRSSTTFFKTSEVWSACSRCMQQFVPASAVPVPTLLSAQLGEAVLSSSQIWGEAYFHAMHEKIFALGAARALIERDERVSIVMDSAPPVVMQMLSVLGLNESRLVIVRDGDAIGVERLHTTYPYQCGVQSTAATLQMRKWIRDKNPSVYDASSSDASDVVVLHRNESGVCNRCLRNTDDVVAALRLRYPTRRVYAWTAGELPLREQMGVFARTELLVAPHGAGLTNAIFLPDHGKIVEIQNHPDYFNDVYVHLSLSLDLGYRGIAPLYVRTDVVDYSLADVDRVVQAAEELLLPPSSSP